MTQLVTALDVLSEETWVSPQNQHKKLSVVKPGGGHGTQNFLLCWEEDSWSPPAIGQAQGLIWDTVLDD